MGQNNTNFSGFSRTQNTGFFNHLNPLYNNERKLYDLLLTEAYNFHGITMTYYILSYDIDKDRLFGEDNNRTIVRSFDTQAYAELPNDKKNFSTMGIMNQDIFHLYISMRHFAVASKYFNGVPSEESYTPRAGDIIRMSLNEINDPTRMTRLNSDFPDPTDLLRTGTMNNNYYEIIMVKKQEEQFLQHQHSWDLIVRAHRDKSIPLSGTSADGAVTETLFGDLWKYTNKNDLFDIGKFINETTDANTNKKDIEFDIPDNCPPRDPFNDWWNDK